MVNSWAFMLGKNYSNYANFFQKTTPLTKTDYTPIKPIEKLYTNKTNRYMIEIRLRIA